MTKARTEKPTPEQRRRFRLFLYLSGLSDIVIGVAIAVLAPEYLAEDAEFYRIAGIILALFSLPMFALGYYHGRDPKDEKGSSQVFRMRD